MDKMLKTINYYAPLTSTITDWWYGSHGKQTNSTKDEQTSLLPAVSEQQKESNVRNETLVETPFTTRLRSVEERPGLSSEDDYVTGSEHYHSSRRNTSEGLLNDSISQIPIIINEEDIQPDENSSGLLNYHYQLDDRVRQIILEGLSETNDEDDDLPSRRKARHQNARPSSSMLSRSAPAGELRKALTVHTIRHIHEHTDSDSSYFESPTKDHPRNRTKSSGGTFPFSFFKSKRNDNIRQRRRADTGEEQTLILKVKTKSYGTTESDDATVLYSENRSQVRSIHRQRDTDITSNEDSDYPEISLNPDHLSASYTHSISNKRKSVSDLSCCSLNSSWSEYTISLPSLETGQECRESDLESTTTTVAKEYLSSTDGGPVTPNVRNNRGKRHSIKSELLTGHHVKEMFMDNECYCCQCTII
eukprot:TCONS_00068565-protein